MKNNPIPPNEHYLKCLLGKQTVSLDNFDGKSTILIIMLIMHKMKITTTTVLNQKKVCPQLAILHILKPTTIAWPD